MRPNSSRFPCCVLLVLSWNTNETNENPSTDKLSRAINWQVTRMWLFTLVYCLRIPGKSEGICIGWLPRATVLLPGILSHTHSTWSTGKASWAGRRAGGWPSSALAERPSQGTEHTAAVVEASTSYLSWSPRRPAGKANCGLMSLFSFTEII